MLLIVLFSHFGLLNGSTSTFVLCFGAHNSHVAVEHVSHKHTESELNATLDSVNAVATVTSTDSACHDIALLSDELLLDLSKLSFDVGPVPAIFVFLVLLAISHRIVRLSLAFDLRFTDSRLLSLRSTILLI